MERVEFEFDCVIVVVDMNAVRRGLEEYINNAIQKKLRLFRYIFRYTEPDMGES